MRQTDRQTDKQTNKQTVPDYIFSVLTFLSELNIKLVKDPLKVLANG